MLARAAGSGRDIANASGQVLAHNGHDAHVGGGGGADATRWAGGDAVATFPRRYARESTTCRERP